MRSTVILYAENENAIRIIECARQQESEFEIIHVASSYSECAEKAAELGADIILFQMKNPVYIIQNFFHELEQFRIAPVLLGFKIVSDDELVFAMTSLHDQLFMERLKRFFIRAMSPQYICHFNYIGEDQRSNLVMESRLSRLEKQEYLNDILRGVTYEEFLYYRKRANLRLNQSGYYVYLWNLMPIEYSDHDLNKNIYYFVGEEFIKECQDVLNMYNSGEVFFINPTKVCMIINDLNYKSESRKQSALREMVQKLNNVTKCRTAFNYMSGYIHHIEDIRSAYDSFDLLRAYHFFCRDVQPLTQQYVDSVKKHIPYDKVDQLLREIKEILYYDLDHPRLEPLIHKLFFEMIKPSLSYNLYYYCLTSLISALSDLYSDAIFGSDSPSHLYFSSIEEKYRELIDFIRELKNRLPYRHPTTQALVLKAIDYIHENYMHDISVNRIALELNVSNSYLSQLFKRELGITIINYIISFRIQKAKELMSSGNELISNIAIKVGYYNEKQFSKMFKKVTGLSPTEYKKRLHARAAAKNRNLRAKKLPPVAHR